MMKAHYGFFVIGPWKILSPPPPQTRSNASFYGLFLQCAENEVIAQKCRKDNILAHFSIVLYRFNWEKNLKGVSMNVWFWY